MVRISDASWEQLLDALNALPRGVERVAYLDGFGTFGDGVVTTITIPKAELHAGWFDISAEAMSEAGAHLRQMGMTRLAQVHTHGGSGCSHSDRDNAMAYSQRTGALSIVLPHHATRRPKLRDGAVHVRLDAGWKQLGGYELPNWIEIVPISYNFWRGSWEPSRTATRGRFAALFSGNRLRDVFHELASAFRGNKPS